jgi:hypothetical protein
MDIQIKDLTSKVVLGDYLVILENKNEVLYKICFIEPKNENNPYGSTIVLKKVGDKETSIEFYEKEGVFYDFYCNKTFEVVKIIKGNLEASEIEILKEYLVMAFEDKYDVGVNDTGSFAGILRGLGYY